MLGRYAVAWLGGAVLGVVNGTARDKFYAGRIGELRAHQLSTATLLGSLVAYTWALERRWPLADRRDAAAVGAAWLGMTVAFEFGFGRLIAHKPWADLLADYNFAKGRLWGLVPAWMAVGPEVVRELKQY